MSTTKQLKVYKGLPTLIKSRARGYYDDKTILTFNTDAESQNITMDVYDGLSYDIVSSASGIKVLNFVNTVLPYKWDYSTALSTNRYCFAPINGGSDVPIYNYNFDVIGSPTINNTTKIVGDFSGSDYLTIDGNPNFQNANSWEFVTKVSVGSTSEHQKILFGYGINFGVTASGYLHLWLYNNGTLFVDSNVCSASLLSANPFIKLSFDGTTYSCYISPDGETWTLEYSYNSTTKVTPNSYTLKLGNSGSEYWRGTIDLSKTSITVNGDAWWIPEFTSHTEKFYYVDCYKYNNFTKVGSPTVDEDTGLVSGFSTSNYIQLRDAFNPANNPWEVQVKFTTSSNVTTAQEILHSRMGTGSSGKYGIGLSIDNTHFNFFCSSDALDWLFDIWGSYTVLTNTTYWVKFGWSGTEYYLEYSLDGETYTRDITQASTSGVYSPLTSSFIGVWNAGSFSKAFDGSIDLSQSYIKVGNDIWWEAKSEYTYNNFSVIGSLNIDYSTSAVSGFSTSNYILSKNNFAIIAHLTPWEVKVKFKLTSSKYNPLFGGTCGSYMPDLFITSDNVMAMAVSSNGSSYNIVNNIIGTTPLSLDTVYYAKYGWTGTEYYAEYSTDDVTYTRELTVSSSTGMYSQSSGFYIGYRCDTSLNGVIYLSDTSISFNSIEWWRGATLNKELMPGILSNYTDDGSAVILNCFAVNGDESVVLTPDNSYGTSRLLGTVSIPSHTVYEYDNGVWTQVQLSTTLHQYDRVDGKATVAGFWTDGNGQRYAVCVADAAYRTGHQLWSSGFQSSKIYYQNSTEALAARETATYINNIMLNEYDAIDIPAFIVAHNACTITIDNKTFGSCLPNIKELQLIYVYRERLDPLDPTLENYPNNSLSTWNIGGNSNSSCWSSTEREAGHPYYYWKYDSGSSIMSDTWGYLAYKSVIPIIEIPVDENGTVMTS